MEVNDLKTYFFTDEGVTYAASGVVFDLRRGEVLGIVGESGCGKSVTALSILRLVPEPGRIVDGEVVFHQENLMRFPEDRMRKIRGDRISIIFQEPGMALNPLFTIGYQIEEAMKAHEKKGDLRKKTLELLERVRMPDPRENYRSYPHQLSGGMQQRAMIAMALSCQPEVLIADEPTTALDVTVQAQILELFGDFRKEEHMTILLISHDLGVVSEIADRIAVMYAGTIVEIGPKDGIIGGPKHPYTKGLLGASLGLGKKGKGSLSVIPGRVPDLNRKIDGCPFSPRCRFKENRCRIEKPKMVNIDRDWWVSCWKT